MVKQKKYASLHSAMLKLISSSSKSQRCSKSNARNGWLRGRSASILPSNTSGIDTRMSGLTCRKISRPLWTRTRRWGGRSKRHWFWSLATWSESWLWSRRNKNWPLKASSPAREDRDRLYSPSHACSGLENDSHSIGVISHSHISIISSYHHIEWLLCPKCPYLLNYMT